MLGGYIVLYPRARVLTLIFIILFFTIIEIPAMVVLGVWFLQQLLFGALGLSDPTGGGGGVAYFAHIGGFVFGLLLIRAFARRKNPNYPPRPASTHGGLTHGPAPCPRRSVLCWSPCSPV